MKKTTDLSNAAILFFHPKPDRITWVGVETSDLFQNRDHYFPHHPIENMMHHADFLQRQPIDRQQWAVKWTNQPCYHPPHFFRLQDTPLF